MVDLDDFRAYLGGQNYGDDTVLERALSTGIALVDRAISGVTDIPDLVLDTAYLACAARVAALQSAPDGVSQFSDGSPRMIPRDPMEPVYPILRPYVGWFA